VILGNYPGAITLLGQKLRELGLQRPFLVTGTVFFEKCGAKAYLDSLASEFSFSIFADSFENPKLEDVFRGIDIFWKSDADCIVAVGGGSVIDMAKLINGLARCLPSEIAESLKSNTAYPPLLPYFAIPTTAGSGSEATHFAVVYYKGIKYSFTHGVLLPDYVILDPNLLKTQSPYQMAVSGLDAFAQSIESFWSVNSTPESRTYSERALKLAWNNLQSMISDNNTESMAAMLLASHLAGKAINISKTTGPHAIAYGFTTNHGIPHGHAVSLSLPYFTFLNMDVSNLICTDPRGEEWVLSILQEVAKILGVQYNLLPLALSEFINGCGITTDFESLNISFDNFMKAIGAVNVDRMRNHPIAIDEKLLTGLYKFNSKH
jgi:alcohol dehydrogenase class IV